MAAAKEKTLSFPLSFATESSIFKQCRFVRADGRMAPFQILKMSFLCSPHTPRPPAKKNAGGGETPGRPPTNSILALPWGEGSGRLEKGGEEGGNASVHNCRPPLLFFPSADFGLTDCML